MLKTCVGIYKIVYLSIETNKRNDMKNLTTFETREKELKDLFKKHPLRTAENDYKIYSRMNSLHGYLLGELKKLNWTSEEIEKYFSNLRGY
jgi:hypothetical protein